MNNNFFENYSNSYRLFKPHTCHNFIGYDSETLFQYNLQNNHSLLEKNGWTHTEIKYWYNNHGFRTYDDFDINDKDVNMFFGCSLTDGVGLNIEDTWAYKMNQKLGGSFYNFGQSGSGVDVTYRLLKAWTSKVIPKNIFIFIYSLHKARREFLHSENYINNSFGPWDIENDNNISILIDELKGDKELQIQKRKLYLDFLSTHKEIELSYQRTWDAIMYVLSQLNCNVYIPKQIKIHRAAKTSRNNQSYARDCFHLGIQFHDMIANFDYWEKIK